MLTKLAAIIFSLCFKKRTLELLLHLPFKVELPTNGLRDIFFLVLKPSSTVKLRPFFWKFQTEERVLRLNKSKITSENTFNRYDFDIEGNYESYKDRRTLFWVFLQIC